MPAPLFDTLRLSRTLRDKGHFTADQAETLAEAFGEASQDNLATKADLRETESRLQAKVEALELRLESKIESIKSDILKWVIGTIGFQTIMILGAALTLFRGVAR